MRLSVFALLVFAAPVEAQILAPARESQLRSAVPRIEFESPFHDGLDWLLYDTSAMPRMVQVRHAGITSFHRVSGVGTGNEFPWQVPGGTTFSGVSTWKAIGKPKGSKIRVWREGDFFNWSLPPSTELYEFLAFPGTLNVFEVRRRVVQSDGSQLTYRYLPFKNAAEAKTAGVSVVKTAPMASEDGSHERRIAFHDRHEKVDFLRGGRSTIAGRMFVRSDWAATSDDNDSIFPKDYRGALAVQSCQQCHDTAGQRLAAFTGESRFGGDWSWLTRGNKAVMSFSPVEPSSASDNREQRPVRFREALIKSGWLEVR